MIGSRPVQPSGEHAFHLTGHHGARARDDQHRGATLAERYAEVRALTDTLAAPLSAEDQTVQSMPDVSPTKWHRAHTTWFFETFVLARARDGLSTRSTRTSDTCSTRTTKPSAHAILVPNAGCCPDPASRRSPTTASTSTTRCSALIATMPPDLLDLVELGLHHEQQHQELLLMDIKHVLSTNPLRPAYRSRLIAAAGEDRRAGLDASTRVAWSRSATTAMGSPSTTSRPRHHVYLEPFALADRPVSCGDWLAFMADDGYHRAELWLSDGWATVQQRELGGAAVLGADRRWLAGVHARGHEADRPERAGVPRQLLRSRRVRPLVGRAPADRGRVGARRPRARPSTGRFLDLDELHPRGRHRCGHRCSATCGSGPRPRTCPTRASTRPPVRSASTTASSWSTSTCCAAAAARHRPGHVRATYRNFFPPAARWAFSGVRLAPTRKPERNRLMADEPVLTVDVHLPPDHRRAAHGGRRGVGA